MKSKTSAEETLIKGEAKTPCVVFQRMDVTLFSHYFLLFLCFSFFLVFTSPAGQHLGVHRKYTKNVLPRALQVA